MDLEQYRIREKLTYEELAEILQLNSRRMARFYALGLIWPKPPVLDLILSMTKGQVTLEAMHQRHAEAYREKQAGSRAEGSTDRNDDALKCSSAGP